MEPPLELLSLPDLALHHICSYLDCPIDLLSVSSTCSKLRKAASSQSFWWRATLKWCEGLWPWIKEPPLLDNPRQWILALLKKYAPLTYSTMSSCEFGAEKWERVDDRKFHCHLGMLRIAYADRDCGHHPAILYQQWLYDIGLYHRINPGLNFAADDFQFDRETICKLASLGQAKERDLRARKQPYIDPVYYIRKVGVAHTNWQDVLFPSGPNGTVAPLLMCPFQDTDSSERSGVYGLTMCLSLVLEKHLKPLCLTNQINPAEMWTLINKAISSFCNHFILLMPLMKDKYGSHFLRPSLKDLSKADSVGLEPWQSDLDKSKVRVSWRVIVREVSHYVEKYNGIDYVVDKIRLRWRHALLNTANSLLHGDAKGNVKVVRVNLTDSDLIGGDNKRQEMSAAAFISDHGILVTWHLTGRLRF